MKASFFDSPYYFYKIALVIKQNYRALNESKLLWVCNLRSSMGEI